MGLCVKEEAAAAGSSSSSSSVAARPPAVPARTFMRCPHACVLAPATPRATQLRPAPRRPRLPAPPPPPHLSPLVPVFLTMMR